LTRKNKMNIDDFEDNHFNPLYLDNGVMIMVDKKEPDDVFTQMIVNGMAFSFDIPKTDFLRLTQAMNYAIRAIKIEKLGRHK
jgi:hypothetical protein